MSSYYKGNLAMVSVSLLRNHCLQNFFFEQLKLLHHSLYGQFAHIKHISSLTSRDKYLQRISVSCVSCVRCLFLTFFSPLQYSVGCEFWIVVVITLLTFFKKQWYFFTESVFGLFSFQSKYSRHSPQECT